MNRRWLACFTSSVAVALVLSLAAAEPVSAKDDKDTPADGPQPIADCKLTTPEGDYALVVLRFELPGADKKDDPTRWMEVASMRDGKVTIAHNIGLRKPGGVLTLKDGKLSGAFINALRDRKGFGEPEPVTLEATVKDGVVTGTCKVEGKDGTVNGRIVPEAELAKGNAIPADKGWPMFLGPVEGGMAATPTGAALVDSPKAIRMVWRSEETDIGESVGSCSRFMDQWSDATGRRTVSGSTSPVAADGKVYLSYYVPSPVQAPSESALTRMIEKGAPEGTTKDGVPWYALEKIYPRVDDVVLCMDAATGKTLWKAVMPGRGRNLQHHKAGPFDMTPGVGGGRVFAIGMSNWLYAFDAKSGKPLWQHALRNSERVLWSSTAVVTREVVVAPKNNKWTGFDPATGKVLWQADLPTQHSTLAVWQQGEKDYVIGGSGGKIRCVDVSDGKVVWSIDAQVLSHGRGQGPGGLVTFDDHIIAYLEVGEDKKNRKADVAAWKLGEGEPKKLWQKSMTHNQAEHMPVIVHGKYVFTGELATYELATGKEIDRGKGIQPGNGGYMQGIEDIVYVRRDGTHGSIDMTFYRVAKDGKITNLNPEDQWSPPIGGATTSYHHALMYPLIDGRVFIRQYAGVYCWDMRKQAE